MQEPFRRFQSLNEKYHFLKEECEGNVISWKWAESKLDDPRPLWYERNRLKRGTILKFPPTRPNGYYEYGYDSKGKLLVARNHVFSEPDRYWYYETFNVHTPDTIESAHFHYNPEKEAINLSRSIYQGNQIILWERCTKHGNGRERYYWDKNHVVSIDIELSRARNPDFVEPTPWQKVEASYTKFGTLDKVVIHWQKHSEQSKELSEIAYRRLIKSENLKLLLDRAKQKIYDAIMSTLSRLNLSEIVYCIAITWSPGQYQSLPPNLGIGFERDRKNWIAEHGKEAKWYLWNPAEFSFQIINHTVFGDSELMEICELLNRECGRHNKWNNASKMLAEVAKMLNRTHWRGILHTTDDFVAYSANYELSDWQNYLKHSISKEMFSRFKKDGLLI